MKKIYSIFALAIAICAFTPSGKAQNTAKGNSGAGWQEKNGLAYNKTISEPNTDGIYTITLESFTTGTVTVTQESTPCDVVLVLDLSGSMNTTKMTAMKNAVKAFIDEINNNDLYIPNTDPKELRPNGRLGNRIALVTFASEGASRLRKQLTTLTDNGASLKSTVDGFTAGGNTYMDEGMEKAYNELNSERMDDSRKIRTVVLFTDGAPGSGNNWTSSNTSRRNATWNVANGTIKQANKIKNMTDETKNISSTVYTVTVENNPGTYTKVFLGKTSSNWTGCESMGTYNTWTTTPNVWVNGGGTQQAGPNPVDMGPKNFAFATTNASELTSIFTTIAQSSGGTSAELDNTSVSEVDIVSASFSLPAGADKNSIKVYTVRYTGDNADGTHNFKTKTVDGQVVEDLIEAPSRTEKYLRKWKDTDGTAHEEMTDVDNAIEWDLTPSQTGSTKKDKITVNGFDYANLWCGPDQTVTSGDYAGWHQGYKIVIKIPVKMDDEAVGGPNLDTNGPGSGIYVNGVNQFPFISPEVSLPVNIHIRKEGLEVGESAKFKIERTTDGTTWTPVTSVFVTRTESDDKEGENAPITKIIGLPATDNSTPAKEYNYRVSEEPWTWSYITGTKTPTTTHDLITNPFIFTNRKKDNIDVKVKNAESKTYNDFRPGSTEGIYVDSKPRTTTTTTNP